MDRPQMIVVGGPNGAGKTTFANQFVSEHLFPYIGADRIAEEISPNDPALAAFEAGRELYAKSTR